MRKSDVVFVMKSYTGIKHKKNYTFGSLSIKVWLNISQLLLYDCSIFINF